MCKDDDETKEAKRIKLLCGFDCINCFTCHFAEFSLVSDFYYCNRLNLKIKTSIIELLNSNI